MDDSKLDGIFEKVIFLAKNENGEFFLANMANMQ